MVKPLLLASLLLLNVFAALPERKVIVPANAAKPVGPYSPGISAGEYLYVSGQGIRDAQNNVPTGVTAQAKQCLENVKAIIEAAGLTMEHVVHMQLYLEQMSDFAEVDRVYASYFPTNPPARVVIGVAKMPTDTTVEMTAVVVRDLKQKKVVKLKSLAPLGHASAAIQVGNRYYFSGVYANSATEAEAQMKMVLSEANLKSKNILFSNFYAPFASALIPMRELPNQAKAAYSVIAARKGIVRVKSSANVCAAEGQTVYCAVQLGNNDTSKSVPDQVKAVMQKLYAGLESHGAKLSMVTASNVLTEIPHVLKLPFDPLKDLKPVSMIARGQVGVLTGTRVPMRMISTCGTARTDDAHRGDDREHGAERHEGRARHPRDVRVVERQRGARRVAEGAGGLLRAEVPRAGFARHEGGAHARETRTSAGGFGASSATASARVTA